MLNIVGFVILIVVTVFAYKTAKDYERNAIGWALITFGVGFAIQIILPIAIVVVIAIAMMAGGSTPAQIQEDLPDITIALICMVLSIIACVLIVRYLAKIPEDEPFIEPPEPPNDFNQNT